MFVLNLPEFLLMYYLIWQGPPGLNGPPGLSGRKVRYEMLQSKQFPLFIIYQPFPVSSVGLHWESGFSRPIRFYWPKSKNTEPENTKKKKSHKEKSQTKICYTTAYF